MSYSSIVLAESSLVGYWKLDEASGTTAADSSSGGHNGTYPSGVYLGEPGMHYADPDTSVQINGGSIDIADASSLSLTGAFSVEFTFAGDATASYEVLASHWGSGTNGGWVIGIYADGTIDFNIKSGTTTSFVATGSGFDDGNPHIVTCRRNGANMYIDIDGVRRATKTNATSGTLNDSTSPVRVGSANLAGYDDFVGHVEKFSLYNDALSDAAVASHHGAALYAQLEADVIAGAAGSADLSVTNASLGTAAHAGATGVAGTSMTQSMSGAGVAKATGEASVGDTISAPLAIPITHPAYDLIAPLRLVVSMPITVSAPMSIEIAHPVYDIAAPLAIAVTGAYTISAPIAVAIELPGLFVAGHANYAPRWRLAVSVGGVDMSARLTGTLTVRLEESAARVAEFALLPNAGAIALYQWAAQAVTIDATVMSLAGADQATYRLFTGVVDVPAYDVVTRVTTLRCTDGLQDVTAAMPRAAVDTLIGGSWSAAAFRADAEPWDYAQDRLSTIPASFDMDHRRAMRVTDWQPAAAFRTLSEGHIEDGSLAVQWADGASLRNTVRIGFAYRFPRCKLRVWNWGWVYPFSLAEIVINGYTIPTTDMVTDALRGTGWDHLYAPTFTHPPRGPIEIDMGGWFAIWVTSDQDLQASTKIGQTSRFNAQYAVADQDVADKLVMTATSIMQRRYVQQIEYAYDITVVHEPSVAAVGELAEDISASMGVEWNAAAWEGWRKPESPPNGWELGADSEADEPPVPVITAPASGEAYVDYAPDAVSDAAARDAAIETLLAIARAKIWASHRQHRVGATVPFDPRLDLIHTVAIDTDEVSAAGKLRGVTHTLDMQSGRAATRLELAICASGSAGSADSLSAPAAPTVPAVTPAAPVDQSGTYVGSAASSVPMSETMVGYFTNVGQLTQSYSPTAPVYPVQFTCESPEIEPAARENLTVTRSARYRVALPQDQFTVEA